MILGTPHLHWFCTDCAMAQEGYDEHELGEAPPEDVLNLVPETAVVTAGMLWEEHSEGCPNRAVRAHIEECACERIEHTSSSCDGCGSRLAGGREAYTVWIKE